MTQDDSHSYVTPEQAPAEIKHLLNFCSACCRDFGLDDFYLELSTRDDDKKDKFIGSEEEWAEATEDPGGGLPGVGPDLVPDPGARRSTGPRSRCRPRTPSGAPGRCRRSSTTSTSRKGFGLEYQAADGSRQQPVMIHSAKFGSIERFIGVLTEHYAGAFPPWLSPGAGARGARRRGVSTTTSGRSWRMKAQGIRVELDESDDRFPKKIRNASKSKVPFVLIAGEEDRAAGAVSFRYRDGRSALPPDERADSLP
jgi:threonyl-tRNA synthetase